MASGDPKVRRRLGSVGKPLPTLELEIRGPNGEVLPAGVSGEIYVRGEQVSGEYLSKKVIRDDGWFPTNDGGHMDEDGYLYVEGRLDDVIVRGGENLSPGEIERVLHDHPAVADAAVVGAPDEEMGEKVVAVIQPMDWDADHEALRSELMAYTRKNLSHVKAPRVIDFMQELPRHPTGKLYKRLIRDRYWGKGEGRIV
jgi:long-chain acyl-CoA synthetase